MPCLDGIASAITTGVQKIGRVVDAAIEQLRLDTYEGNFRRLPEGASVSCIPVLVIVRAW